MRGGLEFGSSSVSYAESRRFESCPRYQLGGKRSAPPHEPNKSGACRPMKEKQKQKASEKMKVIYLSDQKFPSEFSPSEGATAISAIFAKHNLPMGRMVSGSKSRYIEAHPDHIVVFNANVITRSVGKVWYGDIDITLEGNELKAVAEEIGEPLYVLYESDARFGAENKPVEGLIDKALWNTKEED